MIGCTCSFEQITSSAALLNKYKELDPGVITILGGANCEGEMAEGILSLGTRIDYVASGDSEELFPCFLAQALRGRAPAERILHGKPCANLDALPLPDYQDYFDQYNHYLAGADLGPHAPALPYESSRGCWWGEKHHCTFCGLNGNTMAFREKAPDLVIAELLALAGRYPIGGSMRWTTSCRTDTSPRC